MSPAFALTHWDFVWLSYGTTALVVAGLALWIILTGRTRRAKIAQLSAEKDGKSDGG